MSDERQSIPFFLLALAAVVLLGLISMSLDTIATALEAIAVAS